MNVFEVGDRFNRINECINAVIVLLNRPSVHGLDKALLEQERDELIRAYHDTIREFEDECVKRGRKEAAKEAYRMVEAMPSECTLGFLRDFSETGYAR